MVGYNNFECCGQNVGRLSFSCRVIPVIVAAWSVVDMVSDGFTVKKYWNEWEEGPLPGIRDQRVVDSESSRGTS
jgi:hypothetical protein